MKRRKSRDLKYAPTQAIARLWHHKERRRLNRLERREGKREAREQGL